MKKQTLVAQAGKGWEKKLVKLGIKILTIIKHIPGPGRAKVDSHFYLPTIKTSKKVLKEDFYPFIKLKKQPKINFSTSGNYPFSTNINHQNNISDKPNKLIRNHEFIDLDKRIEEEKERS